MLVCVSCFAGREKGLVMIIIIINYFNLMQIYQLFRVSLAALARVFVSFQLVCWLIYIHSHFLLLFCHAIARPSNRVQYSGARQHEKWQILFSRLIDLCFFALNKHLIINA